MGRAADSDGGGSAAYRNVLHELLLALLGKVGDVFVDAAAPAEETAGGHAVRSPWDSGIQLAEDLAWVAPPDRSVLNAVAALGGHYRELDRLVRHERDPSRAGASAYRRAFAAGLAEVLEVYRSGVLRLEQYVRSEAAPPLSALQRFAAEFGPILGPLHFLAYDVAAKGLGGVQLLALLATKAACGVPGLQACLQRLLWHTNQVMYRQLGAWLLHGLLQDPLGEFFIQRSELPPPPGGHEGADAATPTSQPDMALGADPADGLMMEWHHGFQVCVENLPPGVSLPVAETVKFIGQAVRVLRQPCGAFRAQELLPASDTLAATEALSRLQEAPLFNRMAFEHTIEQIRSNVAGHLWQLVVVAAELPSHLRALKDYFLLARGDFWQCFLVEAGALLLAPPRATADSDINIPFHQSALKSTAADDRLFSNLTIRTCKDTPEDEPGAASSQPGAGRRRVYMPKYDNNDWDYLGMEYKVAWPLGMLLTPELLKSYNTLFQYLLRLKRMQLELEEAWRNMKSAEWNKEEARLPLWRLRQLMCHVFTNIQLYLQLDVIEVQYSQLHEAIAQAQDFKEAERAHQDYVKALTSQAFLDISNISSHIESMMAMCRKLCGWVHREAVLGEDSDARSPTEVLRLSSDFHRKVNTVYTILQSPLFSGPNRAPYLRQFLLRLNYNSYMSIYKDRISSGTVANAPQAPPSVRPSAAR